MAVIEACIFGDDIPKHTQCDWYEKSLSQAIHNQDRIGNKHIRYGRITKSFGDTQQIYMKYNNKRDTLNVTIWESKIC